MRLQLTIALLSLTIVSCKSQLNDRDIWVSFEDKTKQLYGFKDLQGNITVSPKYWLCETDTFRTIAFVGIEHEGWVCIDKKLNKLFKPFIYDNGIDFFQNGLIRIEENKKVGFADMNGKIVIQPTYDFVLPFDKNFTAFYSGGKYECMEKEITNCEHFHWTGGLWGFINRNNDTLIQPTLTHEQLFDLNIASLTDKNPNSTSYTSIKGKSKTYYIENVQKSFDAFFKDFLEQVENNNFSYFNSICYPNIKCTYCLLNTKQEYDSLVKAKLYYPDNFFTETRSKEVFPTSKFVKEDYSLVFSKQSLKNLRDTVITETLIDFSNYQYLFPFRNDTLFLKYLNPDQSYYKIDVIVSHYEDKQISYQEHYNFLKTDEGIKFIGYDRTTAGYGQ